MSRTAPWLALSTDWMDSPMLDEATHGERLAWVCLLCHAKAHGRAGRVRLRKNAFAATYRLSIRAVDGMLSRASDAQKCGNGAAIEIEDDFVTIVNWRVYQAKASKAGVGKKPDSPEKGQNSPTKHTSPSTKHRDSSNEESISWCEKHGFAGISDTARRQWTEAYPACDLDRQLASMHQWLLANPRRAKKSNWRRFIINWLNRAQEKGGDVKSNRPATNQQRLGRVAAPTGKYDHLDAPNRKTA